LSTSQAAQLLNIWVAIADAEANEILQAPMPQCLSLLLQGDVCYMKFFFGFSDEAGIDHGTD
jgi:hypothetical protein